MFDLASRVLLRLAIRYVAGNVVRYVMEKSGADEKIQELAQGTCAWIADALAGGICVENAPLQDHSYLPRDVAKKTGRGVIS